MPEAYEEAFEKYLSAPLRNIAFTSLQSVSYWILSYDEESFDVNVPNSCGVSVVEMAFSSYILEITSAWEVALRNGTAFYIEAIVRGRGSMSKLSEQAELLRSFDASNTDLWNRLQNQAASKIDVIGLDGSPQGIHFWFGSESVILALGDSNHNPLDVGDGTDILLFDDAKWQEVQSLLNWKELWSA